MLYLLWDFMCFYYMTISFALMVLLVKLLFTTIINLYVLTV